MLHAIKIPAAPVEQARSLLCEPSDQGGHDAHDMSRVLRAAIAMMDAGSAPLTQLRIYADYLESMAFANPTRWFSAPSNLAWAWRDYFALADRLEQRFSEFAGFPEADNARLILVSTMSLLTSRVLAFVAEEAKHSPEAISLPLLATATGASSRMRRWCAVDEPGKAQMMSVLSYSVIGVATRATEDIVRREPRSSAMIAQTGDALDEVLATVKQLAADYSPRDCFDYGSGAHRAGEPSRAVRALYGVAWSHDMLGQAGYQPSAEQLQSLMSLLESLWHEAHGRPNETKGLLSTAAHLTSAWSSLMEAGGTTSTQTASRSLWIARQANMVAGSDLAVAHALLDLAQAVVAVSGVALRRRLAKNVNLALHAADLVTSVVERCHGAITPQALMGALRNLTCLAAEASEQGVDDCPRLLDRVTAITTAALPHA